jgi:CRISPR/Cas system-associated exonuclease Cas4 (RecB family)
MHLKTLPCKVAGKIDLAYAIDGLVTVVDWKSGTSSGLGEDSLQLAAYGLWAIEHFGCTPETLRVCKVHLGSGEIDFFPIDATVLAMARTRIIQDAERMAYVEPWAEAGVIEAFTPNKKEAICRLCAFKGVCYA